MSLAAKGYSHHKWKGAEYYCYFMYEEYADILEVFQEKKYCQGLRSLQ